MKFFFALSLMLILLPYMAMATDININNINSANSGFNSTTTALPVGGNPGTTLGEQRLIVFQYAAKIWASIIDTGITINVDAKFDVLSCTSSQAVLGSAGPSSAHRNFPNAPLNVTWYPAALANSLAGSDLTTTSEITATFNSEIDNNNNCLNNTNWYYGIDGNKPPNSIELLSVVMHELGHGLGFITFVDLSTGARLSNMNDAYMLNLEDHSLGMHWDQMNDSQRIASSTDMADLHWIGTNVNRQSSNYSYGVTSGHVEQHAPTALALGSSVSHFSTDLTPNELMEPIDTGPKDNPGLSIDLMKDLGWQIFPSFKPALGFFPNLIMTAATDQINFIVRDADSALSGLSFNFISDNATVVAASAISVSGSGNSRTLSFIPGTNGIANITVTVFDGINSDTQNFSLTINIPLDTDADGIPDDLDNCPLDPNPTQLDTDSDGLGDACDTDDDADGLADTVEATLNTNPLLADSDDDGISDFDEVNRDGNPDNYTSGIDLDPNNPDTDGDGIKDGVDTYPLVDNLTNEDIPTIPEWGMMFLLSILLMIGVKFNAKPSRNRL